MPLLEYDEPANPHAGFPSDAHLDSIFENPPTWWERGSGTAFMRFSGTGWGTQLIFAYSTDGAGFIVEFGSASESEEYILVDNSAGEGLAHIKSCGEHHEYELKHIVPKAEALAAVRYFRDFGARVTPSAGFRWEPL